MVFTSMDWSQAYTPQQELAQAILLHPIWYSIGWALVLIHGEHIVCVPYVHSVMSTFELKLKPGDSAGMAAAAAQTSGGCE